MKSRFQKFKDLDRFTQVGKIIDSPFFVITVCFALYFGLLLWVSAGLALIWIIENSQLTIVRELALTWVWAITPVLVLNYWAWNRQMKEIRKKVPKEGKE